MIKHDKAYKSCLMHYHRSTFTPFFYACNNFWRYYDPWKFESDPLFLVSTKTSGSIQVVTALAGWLNTALLSEIQSQSRWMLPLPMQSRITFQRKGRLHSFHLDYKRVTLSMCIVSPTSSNTTKVKRITGRAYPTTVQGLVITTF